MKNKLVTPIIVLLLLSILFTACAPAATQVAVEVVPTTAPEPTETPIPPTPEPTATPEPVLDFQALLTELVAGIPADKGYGTVSAAKLNEELVEKPPFLLDVREPAEVEKDGFIAGAVNIPIRDVLNNLDKLPGLDDSIVVYCASGHRGAFALSALRMLGYTNVRNLGGGLAAWKKAELAVEMGKPAEQQAGTAAIIADEALYTALNNWLTNLPEGFYAAKADKVNAELVESQPFLLDLRSAKEYEEGGWIAGAVNIPLEQLFSSLDQLPTSDTPIIVYCASGHRGAIALMGLQLLGYENVVNLGGGLNAWKAAQFPVEGWVDWMAVWSEALAGMPDSFYTVSAANLNTELVEKPPFLLDVREPAEIEKDGYIAGAVLIPVRDVLKNLDKLPAQDQPIVIYCASGHRGALAMASLQMLGYTNVRNLGGGLGAWKKAELPVEMTLPEAPAAGTAPEVDRTRYEQLDAFLSGLPEGFYSIKAADLNLALAEANAPFILDVREAGELETDGYIESSVNIPLRELFTRLAELPKDKAAPIVVLCKSGHRGALAMMALRMNGYTDVRNLGGGLGAWIAAELPVVK